MRKQKDGHRSRLRGRNKVIDQNVSRGKKNNTDFRRNPGIVGAALVVALLSIAAVAYLILSPKVILLDPSSTKDMSTAFLSGEPWAIYCLDSEGRFSNKFGGLIENEKILLLFFSL